MPVPPKDPARRQRSHAGKRKTTDLAVLPSVYSVPEAPEGLLATTRSQWEEFWGSELGRIADPTTDGPELARLFRYRDEWARLVSELDQDDFEMFSTGSTGQKTLSPVYKGLEQLEKLILPLEDRFGLNPRQRLALGATVVDTAKSLAEVNKRQREQRNPEPQQAPVALATDEG